MTARLPGPRSTGALAVLVPVVLTVVVVQTFAGMLVDVGSTLLVAGAAYLAGRMSR